MRALAMSLLLAAAIAAPAAAQPAAAWKSHLSADSRGLELYPHERVTVRLNGGRLSLVSIVVAKDGEAAAPKPAVRGPDAPMTLVEAPPQTIAFILGEADGKSMLKIESAIDKAFDYRAKMRSPQGSGVTKVCTVLPQLAGYETWEKRHIEALVLSDFAARDTNDVVCP